MSAMKENLESELALVRQQSDAAYQVLLALESKRTELKNQMDDLKAELQRMDEKAVYYPGGKEGDFRKAVQFNKFILGGIVLLGGLGGALAASKGFLPEFLSSPMVGGTCGGFAGVVLNMLRVYFSAENFIYEDLPFVEVESQYDHGYLDVVESQKDLGYYRARFYGHPLYYSEAKLTFWVENKRIGHNPERVKRIPEEMEVLNQRLENLEKDYKEKNQQKDALVEQVVHLEQRLKRAKFSEKNKVPLPALEPTAEPIAEVKKPASDPMDVIPLSTASEGGPLPAAALAPSTLTFRGRINGSADRPKDTSPKNSLDFLS